MVFGLSDQDLIPLLDRVWRHFHALARSRWLWHRRWHFGHHALQVSRIMQRELAAGQELILLSLSTADLHTLTPVATSWLGIAVFTDGKQ